MKLRAMLTFLIIALLDNCSAAVIREKEEYLSGIQMIIDSLNKSDKEVSETIDKIPNLNEVFVRLNGTILSEVLNKVKNPDGLLYLLNNKVLTTVMRNIPFETYEKIEPHLNTTKLRLQVKWRYREPHDPGPPVRTVHQLILLQMPNIPFAHVDSLDGINVSALHYIITNHYALSTVLVLMQPKTLEYVFKNAPYLTNYIARMGSQAQFDIMSKLPNACKYLQSVNSEQTKRIFNNLSSYGMCASETTLKTN
ncbi:unnamed protein product [Hymenolepis diminuta]|uniref:Secreted protein n=1 Tax=Hymenolepis diminuta TaxID=6216 RepID=A0A0R3SSG5_HYMDI|nr:unnamed protein product [Hymenolepis diminuta]VUZ52170.1 unnamed protein product [Hymenolepis diminuta]